MEKNQLQIKEFELHLKTLKFKILHNKKKHETHNTNTSNIDNRQFLKTLYLINFQDKLEGKMLNRSVINLLNLLKSDVNTYICDVASENPAFTNEYTQTFNINMLYKLHKIKN